MFERILVPLDGSTRAEQALPIAEHIARAVKGSIVLLQVVDTLNRFGAYSPGSAAFLQAQMEKDRANAASYLARLATSDEFKGIETRIAVFSGQPALSILDVVQEQKIDLVVLCSHGYRNVKRWILGSVAQKIVRQSSAPVLLIREQNLKLKEKLAHPLRVLLALDGSIYAEEALLPTAHLVAALSGAEKGELHLMQLVETPTFEEEFNFMLDADVNFRQTAIQTASNYLQAVRTTLLQELPAPANIQITWSVEECKDIAEALIQIAESGNGIGTRQTSDLIALTTHGRSGLHRWIAGSVTEHVLNGSTLPLFIIHPQKASQELSAANDEPPQTSRKEVNV